MNVQPHEDHGFFGPGSVTWKVWSYPTSLTVGFQRAVVIEELDPALVAAVSDTRAIWTRPRSRYERTIRYFAMVAFGGSRAAMQAADVLVKVHSRAVGTDPVTGRRYDANDPRSQLWILLTGWHSVLYAYEKFGPGKLSEAEEEQYWAECAMAAELQTCDPDEVPRHRAGVRAYFAAMRPQLVGSETARSAMEHLLRAEVMLPPIPRALRPVAAVLAGVLRRATIATLPRWMRDMAGFRQSRMTDALVAPVVKSVFRLASLDRRVAVGMLTWLSPATVPVAAPALLGVPAVRPETVSPAQARQRYGYARPALAYLELRARSGAKVFGSSETAAQNDVGGTGFGKII